jgi:hypothetical protein
MAKKKGRNFQSMTEMMEFFRKTGSQGGKKRAALMTPARRKAIAKKAAKARWDKKKKPAGKKEAK